MNKFYLYFLIFAFFVNILFDAGLFFVVIASLVPFNRIPDAGGIILTLVYFVAPITSLMVILISIQKEVDKGKQSNVGSGIEKRG